MDQWKQDTKQFFVGHSRSSGRAKITHPDKLQQKNPWSEKHQISSGQAKNTRPDKLHKNWEKQPSFATLNPTLQTSNQASKTPKNTWKQQ